jgi:uncharacterized protein (DUF2336 family)
MLSGLFSRKQSRRAAPSALPALEYDQQKEMLQDSNPAQRLALASNPSARPEVLYYLASDATSQVRRAVAANPSTPVQADEVLCADVSEEVRSDLALKIARLIPDMPADEVDRVREMTLAILDRLARDQLPRVRAIIAEELKNAIEAPYDVIRRLADDVEAIVAAPVLEFSPLLSDPDFREIIAAGRATEALAAIARRRNLSADIADDLAATLDVAAIADLLANKSAQVREDTLDQLISNAADVEAWHAPLVYRPELSVRAIRRIAGFVATSLVEILAGRTGLDSEIARDLRAIVNKRINTETGRLQDEERTRAHKLDQRNLLDNDALDDAIETSQRDFVTEALAIRSGLSRETVQKMLKKQNPKVITSLAWAAKLSMRTGMRLQTKIAGIPPNRILNARNGTDFPMSANEMQYEIEKAI